MELDASQHQHPLVRGVVAQPFTGPRCGRSIQSSGTTRLAVAICILLCGCDSDVATHTYSDLPAARADALFDKGWLPDILPASAIQIRTDNNLDLNTSTGSFTFNASEFAAFSAKLHAGVSPESPFSDWTDTVDAYHGKGYSAWSYWTDDTQWTFFCRRESNGCDYYAWRGL